MSISTEIFVPAKLERAARRFKLSPRQLQCLVLMASGNTIKMTADKLGISMPMVQRHMRKCRIKVRANSSLHALAVVLLWR